MYCTHRNSQVQNKVVIGQELGAHWDDAYRQGEVTRSWFEVDPARKDRLLHGLDDIALTIGHASGNTTKAAIVRHKCAIAATGNENRRVSACAHR